MTRTVTPWGPWEPAQLSDVAALFAVARVPWWIAGGYAVELAVGRRIRDHGDIDVLLLRRDQLTAQDVLPAWEWWAADPPGMLRPWRRGEALPCGVHDIWCRPGPGEPWRIQVMLDESDGDEWVSRRCEGVRRGVSGLGVRSADGVPYLAPEVQLYYKAEAPRPKDELDFAAVLPLLDPVQRNWLADALGEAYGAGHPWRPRLSAPLGGPV
ncbi:nucleotidyltransferase domain-containing protein [Streptomyces sp. NPDC091292]|uniref:nucleotidyltransferase domain-containing protein n=1 Tax=Streptomyces sp. NPDC091292 TaxID=3365991 RepID=UPI003811BBF0